jgi:hypothetical protein
MKTGIRFPCPCNNLLLNSFSNAPGYAPNGRGGFGFRDRPAARLAQPRHPLRPSFPIPVVRTHQLLSRIILADIVQPERKNTIVRAEDEELFFASVSGRQQAPPHRQCLERRVGFA